MSRYKIKYIDYIDGEYKKQYPNNNKIPLFLAFPNYKVTSQKSKNVFLLENKLLTAIFDVVHSGSETNHRRRIQVKNDQYYENNLIPFGIHVSGDIFSYIFFQNNYFLKNVNSITSIWINYEMIILNIKKKINIKYKTKINSKEEYIYITNSFEDFINDRESFIEISNNNDAIIKIKNELKSFDCEEKEQKQNSDEIKSIFSKQKPKLNEKEDGRRAERLIYDKLSSDLVWSQISFDIDELTSVEWININEEQYKPYDFLINNNIYVDVKGTWESKTSFIITENENIFRKEIIKKNNKYFIVNVLEVQNESSHTINIYDDELISKLNEKIEKKYIYKGEK